MVCIGSSGVKHFPLIRVYSRATVFVTSSQISPFSRRVNCACPGCTAMPPKKICGYGFSFLRPTLTGNSASLQQMAWDSCGSSLRLTKCGALGSSSFLFISRASSLILSASFYSASFCANGFSIYSISCSAWSIDSIRSVAEPMPRSFRLMVPSPYAAFMSISLSL